MLSTGTAMCGIVGFVGPSAVRMKSLVEKQSRAMEARGPNGNGTWADEPAVLAHRRLKIIDLSERSRQPAISRDGRYVLTYNGEIYNFRELVTPPLPGDTLTLLHGQPLATAPSKLRGMFAYGLWDRWESRLDLVRDRFGMKPLYYSHGPAGLAFGSTAGSVAALAGPAIDAAGVASYLRLGSVQGPSTIYDGVREVDPGTVLTWTSRGGRQESRYWSVDDRPGTVSTDLHSVIAGAVEAHCVSDVPIALFLSGGVDSAALGALAVEAGIDITAFTLGFRGLAIDEIEDATTTARMLGLKHQVVERGDAAPDFDAFFSSIDQPTTDGLNTYLISQAAAQAGFRVAITGLGADELFGGYSTFRRIPALFALNHAPSFRLRRAALRGTRGNRSKAEDLAEAGRDFNRIHEELRSVFSRAEVKRLTGVDWQPARSSVAASKPMDAVTRLELDRYLRNTLLRDSDAFSMAHSLELRMPFVDHHVLASVSAIRNGRRALHRKGLLAAAVRNPRVRDVLRKPKRGFTLPIADWLRGPLSDRVDDLPHGRLAGLCDDTELATHVAAWRAGRSHHSKIWALVVLEAWSSRFGPPRSDIPSDA
jgi:asparagine synthase (glutamine-hydrolysing)